MKSERPRYVVCRIESKADKTEFATLPSSKQISGIVWKKLRELYGTVGASDIAMHLIESEGQNEMVIFRTHHRAVSRLRAALSPVLEISNTGFVLRPLKTTGLLSKAHKLAASLQSEEEKE